MYLLIKPNGGKYWRFRYRYNKKQKEIALGVFPSISLKEARDKRDEYRKQVASGIDPSEQKKIEKLTLQINQENNFRNVANEWFDYKKPSITENHGKDLWKRLERDIFPVIGFRPLNEIKPQELLVALRAIEKRGAIHTAQKTLQSCGQIFRFAVASGIAERDITGDLRGALATYKPKNHARLEEKDLPEFLQKLDEYDGDVQTQIGLKLLLLTFVRTTELRAATWDEFDFDKAEWVIPAERMKMREKHIVPLSTQALSLFKELQLLNGNREHILPNRNKPTGFISENTLLYAMYRMGYHKKATPHGLRATASTILNENKFRPDVIERQLAHAERNRIRAAYNHAEYMEERIEMIQWWGDYLEKVGL